MPFECEFTGKKTKFGKKRTWHGQAITKGGFGLKPTGITRRTFRPNLQDVTAIIDGAPTRVKASARAIRSGMSSSPSSASTATPARRRACRLTDSEAHRIHQEPGNCPGSCVFRRDAN